MKNKCGAKCEVITRVVGYHRPVAHWNLGKKAEFSKRVTFDLDASLKSKFATIGKPTAAVQTLSNY